VTVPSLSVGTHLVTVTNDGVPYTFTINMNPTLILTPSSGAVGVSVSIAAYGFPTSGGGFNGKVSIYWYEHQWADDTNYFLVNATVGSNGEFNVTSVKFSVPLTFGGVHDVVASKIYYGKTTGFISGPNYITEALFTVLPTLTVSPTSVNANAEGFIVASGTGFSPDETYVVNVDHTASGAMFISGGGTGDLQVNFTSAGFAPGIHQIEIDCYYFDDGVPCQIENQYGNVSAPFAFVYFNVTTTGDYLINYIGNLHSLTTTLNTINSNVNTILGWQTTIQGISTNVDTINSNVNTILGWQSTITSINTAVQGLSTTLGTLGTQITGLTNSLTTVSGTLTSIQNTVNTIESAVGSSGTIGSAISSMSSQVSSTQSSVSSVTTYVLVVAVLAAITLVLELAVLIRKLS